MKRGVSRAVCLLVAMALLGVGVSAPSSPDAQATSVDPRSVQATFVGSAMFEGRLLPVDAQGRVFMERGGIWVPVGAVKPAQTQASTTSLAADRDQDKVVDALEAIYGNNDDRPMRVMVSVGRETLVDANRAVLGEGGTVTRIIGAGPDAVIAARLDRDGAQKVAQLDGVIAVWPDLVVSVSPPRTLESTPTSGVPSASVEPQDALRGLPALRTAQGVTGAGIDVAVIDTGVDARHTSISGRVAHRQNFVTTDSGCSYGSPGVGDGNGHGTHVAGIIAGSGSVGGVAPGARIVGLRVLTCSGSGQNSDIVAAIDWLAANRNNAGLGLNVRVANISLGSFSCYTLFDGTDPMSIAVNRLVAAGVATYVAAGNSADRDGCGVLGTVGTPGAADYGTTVGASTPEQSQGVDLAFFSSRGLYNQARTKPEFSVPGANIRSAKANTSNFAAGTSVTDWVTMSGTSMATPFAAGLAALALQRRPELVPSGTSCEVAADCPLGVVGASMSLPLRDLEISTAIDRGAAGVDMVWGHGLADPYAILGTTGTAYPVGTATVLNVATDMMDAKLRLTVAENKPVSLSFHRVVASLSTTNIKAHGGVSIPYVTLRRLSDGVELPMYTGHFLSSGYISWLLNGRTWNTGATNIAPGRYELQVFITGMTGDLLVTGSNVSSIVPTSSLVTVSTPSGVVRPGTSSSITITNNAAYALTAKAVDLNAVTDLSDAGAEIAAGQSRTVNFAVPAGATASATRLYAEVTASSVSEDVGTRSGSRNIVIRAGMAAASAGAFPAAERVDGNADGTSFSPPFRDSFEPGMGSRMSADGSVVAFWKEGTLVTSDGVNQTGSDGHVYIRDRVAGTTVLMGGTTLRSSITKLWDLSDDGDLVVFSTTKNLVVGDTNASNCNDLYTYRRSTGVFTLVGVLPAGYTSPCVGSMDVNEMQADLSPDGTKVLWARSGDMGPGTKVFRLSWFVTTLSPVSTTLINAPHDGSATPSSGTKMFTQPAWNAASDTVVFYTPDYDTLDPALGVTRSTVVAVNLSDGSKWSPLVGGTVVVGFAEPIAVLGNTIYWTGPDSSKSNFGRVVKALLVPGSPVTGAGVPLGTTLSMVARPTDTVMSVQMSHAYENDPPMCGVFDPSTLKFAPYRDETGDPVKHHCTQGYLADSRGYLASTLVGGRLARVDLDANSDYYAYKVTSADMDRMNASYAPATGTAGSPVSIPINLTGGRSPYVFHSPDAEVMAVDGVAAKPAWLTINSSTGALTGTPASAGTYTSAVVVRDADGRREQVSFTLTVGSAVTTTTVAAATTTVAPATTTTVAPATTTTTVAAVTTTTVAATTTTVARAPIQVAVTTTTPVAATTLPATSTTAPVTQAAVLTPSAPAPNTPVALPTVRIAVPQPAPAAVAAAVSMTRTGTKVKTTIRPPQKGTKVISYTVVFERISGPGKSVVRAGSPNGRLALSVTSPVVSGTRYRTKISAVLANGRLRVWTGPTFKG